MSAPEESLLDIEILNGFREESRGLLKELTTIVEELESPFQVFPVKLMEDYSQRIDRIMGAAKTILMADPTHIGLQSIGKISEICKKMGYRAAERKNPALIPLFAAFWSDVIEVLEELLDVLEDKEKTIQLAKSFSPILQNRLEWLLKKTDPNVGNGTLQVQRDGQSRELKEGEQLSAQDFANLLKELGV